MVLSKVVCVSRLSKISTDGRHVNTKGYLFQQISGNYFQRTKKPGESRTGHGLRNQAETMTVLESNADLKLLIPSPIPCAVGLQSEVAHESWPVAQVKRVAAVDDTAMANKTKTHAVAQ